MLPTRSDMISFLGLVLNTVGAFLILVPDIPRLYRLSHRVPPLKTIEMGEKQLYHDGELAPKHPGFEHIVEAFLSGSPPLSDAPRLDEAETNSVMVRVGDTELEFDDGGFNVKRILRDEGESISDSTYTVEMYSQPALAVKEHFTDFGVPTPNPYISMETAQGAFPEYIEKYKRRLFFRAGAGLLLFGFLLQAADRLVL